MMFAWRRRCHFPKEFLPMAFTKSLRNLAMAGAATAALGAGSVAYA